MRPPKDIFLSSLSSHSTAAFPYLPLFHIFIHLPRFLAISICLMSSHPSAMFSPHKTLSLVCVCVPLGADWPIQHSSAGQHTSLAPPKGADWEHPPWQSPSSTGPRWSRWTGRARIWGSRWAWGSWVSWGSQWTGQPGVPQDLSHQEPESWDLSWPS